jgi:hypothetical protein
MENTRVELKLMLPVVTMRRKSQLKSTVSSSVCIGRCVQFDAIHQVFEWKDLPDQIISTPAAFVFEKRVNSEYREILLSCLQRSAVVCVRSHVFIYLKLHAI